MLLAKSFKKPQQEPTFQDVKVTPTKAPPAGAAETSKLFMPPTEPVD